MATYVKFSDLVGKTLRSIKKDNERLIFKSVDGYCWEMEHLQDCCESVYIEDICGDLEDLIGSPILQADESSNSDHLTYLDQGAESFTWTFYRIATNKGHVVIRWFGTSNGYYSETVGLYLIKEGKNNNN